jgi:dTDP-glucose 4,6-dehydratase
MKIFVTGGAGFIGSNFIRHVLSQKKGYQVVNFDKLTYAGNLANLESVADDPNYSFVRGSICDTPAVEEAMRGCDAVVHFAAESHVDRSIYEPAAAIDTNVTGTFAPSSPYSASKASSDLLVLSYVRTYNFPGVITRSSNNYGPYQFPEKFLPLMITNTFDNKQLPIYGDGKQQRDWLHVEDNCRGVLAVLEKGSIGQVYNIGGLDVEENLTIARTLLRLIGKPESLLSYVKDRPGHDRRYALLCDKMEKDLGWKPVVLLEDGLRQTIDWYKSNAKWMAGVRDGDYLSYYDKYYENRDSSLHALSSSGPKNAR